MAADGRSPRFLRRMAALFYDALLLGGILFALALPLPLIPDSMRSLWWVRLAIQAYLLAGGFLFFAWFWVHGGQTLGLRAWRMRLVRDDGRPLSWSIAARRYMAALLSWACVGLGFLWALVDRDSRTWHGRLSGSRITLTAGSDSLHAPQQQHRGTHEQQRRQQRADERRNVVDQDDKAETLVEHEERQAQHDA